MKKILSLFLFLLTLNFSDLFAKSSYSRLSIGAGLNNFQENGYAICPNPGDAGCDASSGSTTPTVPYMQSSTAFNLEYFTSFNVLKYLKPFVGFVYTDAEAYYGYGGLSGDLYFGDCKCIVITPSLAAGWYNDGSEIKLGHKVEFRSGGDITYRFKNNVRIGLGFFHLSNANLGNRNPGSEQVIFKYQIPFK